MTNVFEDGLTEFEDNAVRTILELRINFCLTIKIFHTVVHDSFL